MSKHLRMLQGNDFGVACCPEPRSLAVARTTLHPTRPGLSMTNPLNKGVVSWSTGCSQMWLMEHVSKLVPSDSQILHWIQIDLPISIWIHSKTIYSVPRSSTCFTSSIFQYNTQTFHKIRLFIYKKNKPSQHRLFLHLSHVQNSYDIFHSTDLVDRHPYNV